MEKTNYNAFILKMDCMIGRAFVFEQESQTTVNEWRSSTLEVHLKLEWPYKRLFNFQALGTIILKQGLTTNILPLSKFPRLMCCKVTSS